MTHLDVGDGHSIAYELHGAGPPRAVVLHGGPGSGSSAAIAGLFDGVVLFDQRQCGASTPHAADVGVDVDNNTTERLLHDIEALREHLDIGRWLVHGHSWGSALGLLYTQRHPERVEALVVSGVALGRRAELDWLYRGGLAGQRPEAWACFVDGVEGDPIEWYAERLSDSDPAVCADAARRWSAWDWATASNDPPPASWLDPRFQLARARICAHFFRHDCWLDDDTILGAAPELCGIPGAIINGERDLQTPVNGARELAMAWPDAELVIVEDAGHAMGATLAGAIARWTRRAG